MMGGLSFTSTLNIDRRINAKTSSTTQDAMMSWPMGVSTIFPDFNADAATPKLVGLKEAPTAKADLNPTSLPLAMANPIKQWQNRSGNTNGQGSQTGFSQLSNIQLNS